MPKSGYKTPISLENDRKEFKSLLAEREIEIEELNGSSKKDKEAYKEHLISKHKEIEKLQAILDNDHRDCKKHLSMKDKEIERLKGMIEDGYNPHKTAVFRYEQEMRKKIEELEMRFVKDRDKHKDELQKSKSKYENKLQEYLGVISISKDEVFRLTSELQKKTKENEKIHETSIKKEGKIRELETKQEKMCMIIEQYKVINNNVIDSNVEKEDRIRELEKELECAENIKENLSRRLEEASIALKSSEKDYELLHKEFDKGNARIRQLKQKEHYINELEESTTHLHMKLNIEMEENKRLNQHISRYSDRVTQLGKEIENLKHFSAPQKTFVKREILEAELVDNRVTYKDLLKQFTNLKKDKENADNKISSLTKALLDKEKDSESLKVDLKRIEDLSNKCTNLSKDRTVSDRKVSELSKVVEEKETELELLRKHLERSEEKVSELSKEINVIKVSQQQTADEKLQTFQEENSSLQSALLRATTQIEDLSNKCTYLQKYRTDAEHKLSKLSKAVKEKENEIGSLKKDQKRIEELSDKCTNLLKDREDAECKVNELLKAVEEKETDLELLRKHLARSEENVSKLSKEINVIKLSHRQTADEKLQAFQKKNNSLQLALSKATIQIEDLSNKCRDLEKYKRDVEHNFSKLSNTVKEKEREIGSLKKYKEWYEDSLNKCSNLEKNITDLEHETSMLSNLLEEKENEMISVIKDLERAEENISKSQITDEKLRSLKKENASLESAFAKKATEMKDLLNKYTNLQKNNADAEQRLRKLSNEVEKYEYEINQLKTHIETLKSKNTDFKIGKEEAEKKVSMLNDALDEKKIDTESMSRDLERLKDLSQKYNHLQIANANAEQRINNLYKKLHEREREIETLVNEIERRHCNELWREKDHDLNRSSSGAEGNGKRDHKGLM